MYKHTYRHFAEQVSPLPLPHRQDAFAAGVHRQDVTAAVQLGECHRDDAGIELAHAEYVQRLERLGAPDAHVCLGFAISAGTLAGTDQLPGGVDLHAGWEEMKIDD